MKKKKPERDRSIKVSGIVVPADWDSNGQVIAYAISTFNEKEYLIRHIDDRSDLEQFLGKKVCIDGALIQSESQKTIRIKMIGMM